MNCDICQGKNRERLHIVYLPPEYQDGILAAVIPKSIAGQIGRGICFIYSLKGAFDFFISFLVWEKFGLH